MLANRRATMATSKTGPVSRLEEVSATPSRGKVIPSTTPRATGSPALTAQRQMASPATRLPRPGGSVANSPAINRSGTAPASASTSSSSAAARAPVSESPSRSQLPSLSRPTIQAPTSRVQKMSDPFASTAPRASMMPLARHVPPPRAPSPPPPFDAVSAAINNIRHDDPNETIEALKHLGGLLAETPQFFEDCVGTLLDTLLDELDRVFTPPEQVHERNNFRLVKHLVQAFSGIACCTDLIRRLNVDSLYALLYAVTQRMISCDRLGGEVVGLARFMNLIIIQALSTPDRYIVYKAMFKLLHDLTINFVVDQVQPTDEIAAHADLVLKCLWKRCKIIDEDLKSGRVEAGKLLGILEEFLDSIGPTEWTRRGKNGVPLGVLPLRTIKTVLQRTLGKFAYSGWELMCSICP